MNQVRRDELQHERDSVADHLEESEVDDSELGDGALPWAGAMGEDAGDAARRGAGADPAAADQAADVPWQSGSLPPSD